MLSATYTLTLAYTVLLAIVSAFSSATADANDRPTNSPVDATAEQAATQTRSAETPQAAAERHSRVAARRAKIFLLCHRGAVEFAHENTLEGYRATFELGADGNEIDIRATRDGVLVCFHDDMLDGILEDAYGDVADYSWNELQQFRFRRPGPFGEHCRIPTLREVLELHRENAGLLHLDIKRAGLDEAIAGLLSEMDLWDHVVQVNRATGPRIAADSRIRVMSYKDGLYLDRTEVDPIAIKAALGKPGDGIMLEDPRGVLRELGRTFQRPSDTPVTPERRHAAFVERNRREPQRDRSLTVPQLREVLLDGADWNQPPQSAEERAASAERIVKRTRAADALRHRGPLTDAATLSALTRRVKHRSLHPDWQFHGLDGAAALRTLIAVQAPPAIKLARMCLWRDDPAVEIVRNPQYRNPRSWTDFRTKFQVFDWLQDLSGSETTRLCKDYLQLSDEEANQIGIPVFEQAAGTLLIVSPETTTAVELLRHRRSDVRGRAILHCLKHSDDEWAVSALKQAAPHALQYRFQR